VDWYHDEIFITSYFHKEAINSCIGQSAKQQPTPVDHIPPSDLPKPIFLKCIYDYTAQEPNELSLVEGDVFLLVKSYPNSEYAEIRELLKSLVGLKGCTKEKSACFQQLLPHQWKLDAMSKLVLTMMLKKAMNWQEYYPL
jgi:hypothetical protein